MPPAAAVHSADLVLGPGVHHGPRHASALLEFDRAERDKDALEYPTPGIINTLVAKKYLLAPNYWNYWGGATQPYYPASREVTITSPPATWWEQRGDWRDVWERLGSGVDGAARWPLHGQHPKTGKERCTPSPGLIPAPPERPRLWWEWLEAGPSEGGLAGGLEAAKAGAKGAALSEAKGELGVDGAGEEGCPDGKIELASPASKAWSQAEAIAQATSAATSHPSADATQARVGGDATQGHAAGPEGEEEERFDAMHPPELSREQGDWLRGNSLRRQTLPGYPKALSPWGLQGATPRLSRFDDANQAATMDPRLLEPVKPPSKGAKDASLRPYDGKIKGGLGKMVKNMISEKMIGGTGLEYKALLKVLSNEPDFMRRYTSGEIFRLLHPDVHTEHQHEGSTDSGGGRPLPPSEPERARWEAPSKPDFGAAYRHHWRKFWPHIQREIFSSGPPAPARREAGRLPQQWLALNEALQAASAHFQERLQAVAARIQALHPVRYSRQ